MMLCVSNVIIFPYQKENILRRKWYVLNLVCFGSGTATFDKRGTIESEIEERCWLEIVKQRLMLTLMSCIAYLFGLSLS